MVSWHTLDICPHVAFPENLDHLLVRAKPAVSDNQVLEALQALGSIWADAAQSL